MPPIKQTGTDFQLRVWQSLLEIPYGQTISYGELARRIGCRSAQAVGQAVGRNPISIIVPCHRVIGSNGSLVGYEWGLERKQYLLQLEKQSLIPSLIP
jgi:methylated-DNA-[protein]-cysteine S-methyltransferase